MAVTREELQTMFGDGLSLRAMATRLGVSYTTVRYWMGRHGLATPRARRLAETAAAREAGPRQLHRRLWDPRRGDVGPPRSRWVPVCAMS